MLYFRYFRWANLDWACPAVGQCLNVGMDGGAQTSRTPYPRKMRDSVWPIECSFQNSTLELEPANTAESEVKR
jgi:hypothetical protein